ncbi:hypothetical protein L198_01255 [Cryptococcus wingfieldii CBS 7118]|uniref:N-acetyltransferase domain-containing protein n=1 Tax=Cryptococcus wingfieldii CBS 7118 TaxID=1295528 RepID=A0A1E3K0L4_9TREE|nr:hypothetical protein L198_01255 [Cryptococcus wingfieldii CBS 7118]ODO06027.1 hypothetical protein L198_01255 [Cryptococcus wingfieldii CBS 7118]
MTQIHTTGATVSNTKPFPPSAVIVRPATIDDMPRKSDITSWYVLNSLSEFMSQPRTLEQEISNFDASRAEGFPYLVAEVDGYVVGYTKLRAYNGGGGWARTAEVSVYVDHEYLYRGIGSLLLQKLWDVLGHPENYDESWLGGTKRGEAHSIVNVIARMVVNPEGREKGEGLAKFYESMGFERTGRLKKVGWNEGQWLDIIELQKRFE